MTDPTIDRLVAVEDALKKAYARLRASDRPELARGVFLHALGELGYVVSPDSDPHTETLWEGSRDRQRPADYLHDMGDEASHRRLAEALHATPAAVLLSGYPSPLYEDLYADWPRIEIAVMAHASNAVTADRGERTEVIWSNRQPGAGTLFESPSDVRVVRADTPHHKATQ